MAERGIACGSEVREEFSAARYINSDAATYGGEVGQLTCCTALDIARDGRRRHETSAFIEGATPSAPADRAGPGTTKSTSRLAATTRAAERIVMPMMIGRS